MIKIDDVSVLFKQKKQEIQAVHQVNLHIEKGDIFGIIGYSGAGKSTLLRCINFLEQPTSGKIEVDGVDLSTLNKNELRRARASIGMIFQQFNLIASKTVYENIVFNLVAANVPKEEHATRVNELLTLVGLSDKATSYPKELSGGQKQRVGIARALANNPKILLCDEATSALDPETTKQILSLLKKINESLGITIVLVTHEMEVIKSICHKVAVMEKGRIVESNRVYDLFAHPQSDLMKQFVASLYDDALPSQVFNHNEKDTLLTLVFHSNNAEEPVIDKLKDLFEVSVSILQGKIEYIQDEPLGHLTIALSGKDEEKEKALSYLRSVVSQVKVVTSCD
ncbi:ATP-binding cassette domain-containing protein [Granulicatella sp. zg-ZJ]|uniref:methionine ABC transporter ATP-binding protein n=1 Tax=unclassified Granulicatella TaxID=2630493 RepID=UPI0013BFAF36|nr:MULTISPECIES: ATP-binding cassette domain-containing protein [unclassified Granulicatella]MBS4750905.1 ATP-binding cassette domain-containing protein [Carnobacteriaceae bacterium zg-ZUI78]NEW62787.1 ATP-binding cassette domain-containing protein [Granulicatella sp. zg-ZJ]NEW65411.1 ATP-binding cassette domain-containing protein [Granulicatella sp. zg-84]QMI85209.1 ATP-binding cassette domain-containing protein [Carnobacteriaceae bacterium zg-84]